MQEVARVAVGTDSYGTYYLILSREVVSQNIASNYSLVKIQVSLQCPVWINFSSATLKLTSSTGELGTINLPSSFSTGTHVLWNNGDGWTLGHNDVGVLDYSISAYIHATYLLDGTVTGKITAPNIPRYTTVTQSLNSKTETTIKMNWSTTDTVDYVWYSKDNGSTWVAVGTVNAKSGTYTISGISANTTYNIKTRVRRKDSQLTSDTSNLQVTTYKVPTQSLNSKTETSITINWACDTNIDHLWYSINNGSSWIDAGSKSGTSGNYTITGLSPSTAYNIKTRVRRKATQTTYDTSALTVNTYDYPHITAVETSNLIIGNSQKLTLYNPLGRNVTIKMLKDNASGTQLYTGTTTSTSFTFTPNASALYNSIPNNKSSNCVYSCIYSSSTRTTQARTYSINENNCKPTFSNFAYADVFGTYNLTGNNQILVNGYSQCKFIISTANKAVAKNGASMSSYLCEYGEKNAWVAYSSSEEKTVIVSNSTGGILKVTAVDSRGLTTTVIKTVPCIVYVNPVINELETRREDGMNEKTFLRGKFSIWRGNWQNGPNVSYNNQLKYVGYRVFDGTSWTSYFDITSKVKAVMTTQNNNNTTIHAFSFNDGIEIHANGLNSGFEVGKEYKVQVLIRDGTTNLTFEPTTYQPTFQADVTDGKVGFSMNKDENGDYHIGINGMPDDEYLIAVNGIGVLKMIDI